MKGWAVALNGVMFTAGCSEHESCQDLTVIDALTTSPKGSGLPGLSTEDVSYFQRDGVKHFKDWYTPRFVTLEGTIGPGDDACGDCLSIREQVVEAVQAWKRTNQDTELVLFPPCDVPHTAENAYPPVPCAADEFGFGEGPFGESPFGGGTTGCDEIARNLLSNPSAETEVGWLSNASGDYTVTWDTDEFYVGSKSRRSERTDDSVDPNDPFVASLYSVGSNTDTWEPSTPEATAGLTYTASAWMRAGQDGDVGFLSMWFYDAANNPLGSKFGSAEIPLPAGEWTRVSVSGVAPVDTAYVYITEAMVYTPDASPATVGDYANIDAAMITVGALVDYFDGDFAPVYDPGTEAWYTFAWVGDANDSPSVESTQAARFKGTVATGPYGIVGRPRVFTGDYVDRAETIWDFVARFDGVDQRLYILDECGTPGTSTCVHIEPGAQLFSMCRNEDGLLCRNSEGLLCRTTTVEGGLSVEPTDISVGGTERVYPTITLYGPLQSPTVELTTTGEYVGVDAVIGELPVKINTEDGTAFDAEGNSWTHLLRGSLFLSMYPGNYEWRLLAAGVAEVEDPGYALLCLRDTVVSF